LFGTNHNDNLLTFLFLQNFEKIFLIEQNSRKYAGAVHFLTLNSAAPEGYVIKRTLFGETFDIYSHSYLGLGLMSAREKLFGGPPPSKTQITQVTPPSEN